MSIKINSKLLYSILMLTLLATAFTYFQETTTASISEAVIRDSTTENKLQRSILDSKPAFKTSDVYSIPLEKNRMFYEPAIDIFSTYGAIKNVTSGITTSSSEDIIVPENKIKKIEVTPPIQTHTKTQLAESTAPPLPFKYLGKLYGDDEYIIFLNHNGKNLTVKTNELLFEQYKVEQITPPTMIFTYLPLNIKQSLSIGEP